MCIYIYIYICCTKVLNVCNFELTGNANKVKKKKLITFIIF